MSAQTLTLTLPNGLAADVLQQGSGAPLVFLHGHLGRTWDAFLDGLAESYTVYAPQHPGCEDEADLTRLDALPDLLLWYDDLFRALDIHNPILVGHGFGGMVAAEYAAFYPDAVARLVLVDALGLWLDEQPVAHIEGISDARGRQLLVAQPDGAAGRRLFALPEDPAAAAIAVVARMSTRAAVSHFIWPIPDRDLRRRLYRISAPTLALWGAQDRYVPIVYADEFVHAIKAARKVLIDGAAHFPHVEQTAATLAAVREFLAN